MDAGREAVAVLEALGLLAAAAAPVALLPLIGRREHGHGRDVDVAEARPSACVAASGGSGSPASGLLRQLEQLQSRSKTPVA